jgi:hypothetical protein
MEGGQKNNHMLTPVEIAAKKETGNKTLGRNGLRERNTPVIAAVEDAVKKEEGSYWKEWTEGMEQSGACSNGRCSQKEEGRKLLEAMEGEQRTIRCSP